MEKITEQMGKASENAERDHRAIMEMLVSFRESKSKSK